MPQLTRIRRQDGIALVTAMGVLLVLAIVATGVLAVALNAKRQTTVDRNSARALAAAESGLRLGTYYLNQSLPIADSACPGATNPATQTTATGSPLSCPGPTTPYTVTNPDGTTTSFFISGGTTSAPLRCAGAAQPDTSARPGLSYRQRCITATGTSGNVVRRVQARVLAVSYIFPLPGMVGIDHVKLGQGSGSTLSLSQCNAGVLDPSNLSGASLVEGSLGTNGTMTTQLACWGGSLTDLLGENSSRLYMGKSAPATNSGTPNPTTIGAQPGGVVKMTTDLEIPQIDTIFQSGETGVDAALPAGNSNDEGMTITPLLCGSDTYTSSTRTLNLSKTCVVSLAGNNACLGLLDQTACINNPRVYDFCQVNFPNSNGGTIQLPVLATAGYVRLLVDSPGRPGSNCPAGTGGLSIKNGGSLLTNASISLGAQIFVYGSLTDPPGTGVNLISWLNGGSVKTLLVAPRATIQFQNRATITGGVAAWAIESQNGMVYIWDQNVDKVERRALYYRVAYTECARTPTTATDPGSGC